MAARQTVLNWTATVVFNIALPVLTYTMLTGRGIGDAPALAISAGWPLVELGISYARTRHADEFSIIVLIGIVLGVVTSVVFDSARLLLIKDSALTGLFGLVLLGSLLMPRPLMFYFGRKFATGGRPERVGWWNGLWQYPTFRRSQRVLTVVWGAAFLGEAVLRIALTYVLSVSTMVVISGVLPYVVLAALISGTIMFGRRTRAAGAAAAASRAAAVDPASPAA